MSALDKASMTYMSLLVLVMASQKIVTAAVVGTFTIQILDVENPSGKLQDGSYCDSPSPSATLKCDLQLQVCYGTESSDDSIDSCTRIKTVDDLPLDNDILTDLNPDDSPATNIRMNIIDSFPKVLRIKMRVIDNDESGYEVIDEIAQVQQITTTDTIYDMVGRRTQDPATVRAKMAYRCRSSYYGDDCSSTCPQSRSCTGGFYDCNANYETVCLYGFTGTDCNQMTVNQCPNYTVTAPYCAYNNTCYRTGPAYNEISCCCRTGFTGERCQVSSDICATGACQNQGECRGIGPNFEDYECVCKQGTYGTRCETIQMPFREPNCTDASPCSSQSTNVRCTETVLLLCSVSYLRIRWFN